MVVEDDDPMREALVDILELTGADQDNIRSFANGAEVLEFLDEEGGRDAIVICDLAMPHVNGLELYKRVQALTKAPRLKFVFITAYELMRSERRFLEREGLSVLKKPFTSGELVAAILKASGSK